MPLFRSQHQARLLARLFLQPGEEFGLSDLARELGVTAGTIHGEIERLVTAGLIVDRRIGRSRLLRANTEARAAKALTELLALTFGPEIVIREEFCTVDHVDLVVIYGSWARRYRGEVGREPGDVDVMVIGSPDRDDVYDAAERAERRLGVSVNPTVRSRAVWDAAADPLVATASRDALVVIDRAAGPNPEETAPAGGRGGQS